MAWTPTSRCFCHQHSADRAKNVEAVKLAVVAPPAVAQVLEWPALSEADTALSFPRPPLAPRFQSTPRLRVWPAPSTDRCCCGTSARQPRPRSPS